MKESPGRDFNVIYWVCIVLCCVWPMLKTKYRITPITSELGPENVINSLTSGKSIRLQKFPKQNLGTLPNLQSFGLSVLL